MDALARKFGTGVVIIVTYWYIKSINGKHSKSCIGSDLVLFVGVTEFMAKVNTSLLVDDGKTGFLI